MEESQKTTTTTVLNDYVPVIVLFAVDVAVSRVARELGVQRQLALGAPQTPDVPAHVHRGQIETVVDRSTAAGATSPAVAAVLRIGHQSWTVNILQHIHSKDMTCSGTEKRSFIQYITSYTPLAFE